jgi:hypothetical protein
LKLEELGKSPTECKRTLDALLALHHLGVLPVMHTFLFGTILIALKRLVEVMSQLMELGPCSRSSSSIPYRAGREATHPTGLSAPWSHPQIDRLPFLASAVIVHV